MTAPTLDEVKAWPATVDVTTAARALGIAPSTAYEWIRIGEFPVQVISRRGRHRVITAGLVRLLSDPGPGRTRPEMAVAGPTPRGPATTHHTNDPHHKDADDHHDTRRADIAAAPRPETPEAARRERAS